MFEPPLRRAGAGSKPFADFVAPHWAKTDCRGLFIEIEYAKDDRYAVMATGSARQAMPTAMRRCLLVN
jgi:hypothetical protein